MCAYCLHTCVFWMCSCSNPPSWINWSELIFEGSSVNWTTFHWNHSDFSLDIDTSVTVHSGWCMLVCSAHNRVKSGRGIPLNSAGLILIHENREPDLVHLFLSEECWWQPIIYHGESIFESWNRGSWFPLLGNRPSPTLNRRLRKPNVRVRRRIAEPMWRGIQSCSKIVIVAQVAWICQQVVVIQDHSTFKFFPRWT